MANIVQNKYSKIGDEILNEEAKREELKMIVRDYDASAFDHLLDLPETEITIEDYYNAADKAIAEMSPEEVEEYIRAYDNAKQMKQEDMHETAYGEE